MEGCGFYRIQTGHILGDRGLCQINAQLEQLSVDTRCAPEGIGKGNLADECHEFERDTRSPCFPLPALPPPVELEAHAMPSDDGIRLDDKEAVAPVAPNPGQEHPEAPVCPRQPRPLPWPLKHLYLMPQGQILHSQPVSSFQSRENHV